MAHTLHGIPLLDADEQITLKYGKELERAIESDGCTAVTELYHICCVVHDLGYREGIDPWGRTVSRADVDRSFRLCMQKHSKLGRFSPMSWWRWVGVRVGGYFLWKRNS